MVSTFAVFSNMHSKTRVFQLVSGCIWSVASFAHRIVTMYAMPHCFHDKIWIAKCTGFCRHIICVPCAFSGGPCRLLSCNAVIGAESSRTKVGWVGVVETQGTRTRTPRGEECLNLCLASNVGYRGLLQVRVCYCVLSSLLVSKEIPTAKCREQS